jgi:hypothetical protein
MIPATVFDWNHSTKGRLWRSDCVKHHVEPRAYFWVNTTLKEVALCWFMGLGVNNIDTWEEMRKIFLGKHQDFFKERNLREEIFKMTQKDDESLQDYVERFQYNFLQSK